MSIVRTEGFAHFTTAADWNAKGHNVDGSNVSFAPTSGRGGRGCASVGLNANLYEVLPAAEDVVFYHCAVNTPGRAGTRLFAFRSATCDHVQMRGQGDGSLIVYRSDSTFGTDEYSIISATTLGTTGPNVIRNDTWHHFQISYKCHASAGYVYITVDGLSVFTFDGNTYNGGGAVTVSMVGMGGNDGGPNLYSDLVVCDNDGSLNNTLLGDLAVYESVSPVDGDLLQWDRSVASGTYSSYVDDNPQDGDTTYVVSDAIAERICFSFPTVSSNVGTVIAVKETVCHTKQDPTTAIIQLFSRGANDVNHDGSNIACTEDYIFDERIYEQDLSDTSSWTVAKVNATQLGILNASA